MKRGNDLELRDKCIMVVDECATNGTWEWLQRKADSYHFETGVTAMTSKSGVHVYKLGIGNQRCSYSEGQKIGWWVSLWAILFTVKHKFFR